MSGCFRFYDDTIDDPNIQSLSGDAFKTWVNLLCLASKFRKKLPRLDAIAFRLRLPVLDTTRHLDELIRAGLVEGDRYDNLVVYNFYVPSRLNPKEWGELRDMVFKRDNYTCTYCGQHGGRLECDHINPVANGGSHDASNLTTSCFSCNRAKSDKVVSIAEWRSVRKPEAKTVENLCEPPLTTSEELFDKPTTRPS